MHEKFVPGWYGKIPAIGDFSSRRLPTEFIQFWDTWLQDSILTSQGQLGDNWLNIYLNCPIWRFILLPELYDQNIWTGILMPSVDKVGRYFPLTIAVQLEASPGILTAIINAQNWFHNIEQLALRSLNADFSPESLDQHLLKHPFPAPETRPSQTSIREFKLWWKADASLQHEASDRMPQLVIEDFPMFLSHCMEHHFTKSGAQNSLWWHKSLVSNATHLNCFYGLPRPDHFVTLLKGDEYQSI